MKIDKKLIKQLVDHLGEFNLTELEYQEGQTKIKVSKNTKGIEQIKSALTGMLAPKYKENILGMAEIKEVYRATKKTGSIAGAMIVDRIGTDVERVGHLLVALAGHDEAQHLQLPPREAFLIRGAVDAFGHLGGHYLFATEQPGQRIDELFGVSALFVDLAVIFGGELGAQRAHAVADVLVIVLDQGHSGLVLLQVQTR